MKPLSESQTQKALYSIIQFICRLGKSIETENRLASARDCREGENGKPANGKGFLLGVISVPELYNGDGCATLLIYKIHCIVYFY